MRRGILVAFALLAAASAAQPALAQSAWERLREGAREWLGGTEDPAGALARLGGTRVLLKADADDAGASLDQAVQVIRRRLDGLGLAHVGVQRDSAGRILVLAPGVGDVTHALQIIATRARLEFRLVDVSMTASDAMRQGAPTGSEVLFEARTKQPYLVSKAVAVGGEDIANAQAGFDQNDRPDVDFAFTARGARAFGLFTQENIGRPFAVVLDGEVLVAPVIQTPILGGRGQIAGNFTVEQARDLAVLLQAGMLPVRLTVVEQQTVAPAQK